MKKVIFPVLALLIISGFAFAQVSINENNRTVIGKEEAIDTLVCGTLDPKLLVRQDLIGEFYERFGINPSLICLKEPSLYDNPVRQTLVHGTEYNSGENGTIFVQILEDNQGVSDAVCDLSVYYPNKTFFIDDTMTYLNSSNGLYYYDFIVPNDLGVYMVESTCNVPREDRGNVTTFFGDIDSVYHLINASGDNDFYDFGTFGGANEVCSLGFIDVPDQFGGDIRTIYNITNMYLYLKTGGATPTVRIRVNISTENTQTAQNTLITVLEANHTLSGTSTPYLMPNYTSEIILGQHELLRIQVCIYKEGSAVHFFLDYGNSYPSNFTRYIGGLNISQIVQYRGSGEVHVTEAFTGNISLGNVSVIVNSSAIANEIWNYSSRTLTDYNTTELYIELQDIKNILSAMNLTLNQIIDLAELINSNNTDILNAILEINLSQQQQTILLETINNTLTDFNYTTITKIDDLLFLAQQINVTIINNSLILNGYMYDINKTVINNQEKLDQLLLNLQSVNLSIHDQLNLMQLDIIEIENNLTSIASFVVRINLTTEQNQQLLNQIISTLNGNFTLILDNLTNITINDTQLIKDLLMADVFEFSIQDAGTTYGTGLGKQDDGLTITAASIFGGVAYAAPNDVLSLCLDNQTLQHSIATIRCVEGDCVTIQKNSTIICQYGCNPESIPNECNPAPFQSNMYLVIFFIIVLVGIAVAIGKLRS